VNRQRQRLHWRFLSQQRLSSRQQVMYQQRVSFCCRILVSAVNHFLLSNYVVYNESSFAAELCFPQRMYFCCQIAWPAANQFLLSNSGGCNEAVLLPICVSYSEPVSLPNCVFHSKLVVTAEFLCLWQISVPYRIISSVANLHSLLNCVVRSEYAFAVELCGL
jgi:hypothetical protein